MSLVISLSLLGHDEGVRMRTVAHYRNHRSSKGEVFTWPRDQGPSADFSQQLLFLCARCLHLCSALLHTVTRFRHSFETTKT